MTFTSDGIRSGQSGHFRVSNLSLNPGLWSRVKSLFPLPSQSALRGALREDRLVFLPPLRESFDITLSSGPEAA
jgi:hypothetical protein